MQTINEICNFFYKVHPEKDVYLCKNSHIYKVPEKMQQLFNFKPYISFNYLFDIDLTFTQEMFDYLNINFPEYIGKNTQNLYIYPSSDKWQQDSKIILKAMFAKMELVIFDTNKYNYDQYFYIVYEKQDWEEYKIAIGMFSTYLEASTFILNLFKVYGSTKFPFSYSEEYIKNIQKFNPNLLHYSYHYPPTYSIIKVPLLYKSSIHKSPEMIKDSIFFRCDCRIYYEKYDLEHIKYGKCIICQKFYCNKYPWRVPIELQNLFNLEPIISIPYEKGQILDILIPNRRVIFPKREVIDVQLTDKMANYFYIDEKYIGTSLNDVPEFEQKFMDKLLPINYDINTYTPIDDYYHVFQVTDSNDVDISCSLGIFKTKEEALEYIMDIIKTIANTNISNKSFKNFNPNLHIDYVSYHVEKIQLY